LRREQATTETTADLYGMTNKRTDNGETKYRGSPHSALLRVEMTFVED
jgi:hypothetical protein